MENDAWAEKEVVCGGYMEETINCNGCRVQREIREKMMVQKTHVSHWIEC